MNTIAVEALGDRALVICFGAGIDAALNARALAACAVLRDAALPGVEDIAPAYSSVCVRYDPAAWCDPQHVLSPYRRIVASLLPLVENATPAVARVDDAGVEIPVRYGGAEGPDLEEVARRAKLTPAQVIARHCAGDYRVAMLGFAPGFAYLLGLDPALHTPRRAAPRLRVPAGSVAIGGAQTGIYPAELPGGWQLIGRTSRTLFEATREPAALLAPGMRVRFRAVDAGGSATPTA